jgi:NAD(P)-dependent dehydrogenase (short-subunit alcohol dehydrogenase family)
MVGLLADRVALVTGGYRGLGRAIVDAFAAEGARGAAVDLAAEAAVAAPPAGFIAVPADVTNETSLAAAFAATVARFGRLDIVVANAGLVPPWRETEALDLAEWDRVLAVNVRGVAATLKHAVPALKQQGGAIIAMASINAETAHPRQMLYTASKHAVLGLVRAAALDLGRYGIRVNALAPGPIATEALRGRVRHRASEGGPAEAEAFRLLAADTALGRIATADEVARTAVFLASDMASGITGQLIRVDAGLR